MRVPTAIPDSSRWWRTAISAWSILGYEGVSGNQSLQMQVDQLATYLSDLRMRQDSDKLVEYFLL
jgi:hypothetical protein